MGLQSCRRRTLRYVLWTVLQRLPAAPSIQQGTIIWSSRCAQYNFFLLLFISATTSDHSEEHHSSSSCCVPAPWEAVENAGQGPGASPVAELPWGREQCQALLGMPWDRVSLSAAMPTLASFLLGAKQKVEPVSHCYSPILNFWWQSGAGLWVLCLSFFFFLPSPWTQLLTQEEVGYAVTHSIKRPNKSST